MFSLIPALQRYLLWESAHLDTLYRQEEVIPAILIDIVLAGGMAKHYKMQICERCL